MAPLAGGLQAPPAYFRASADVLSVMPELGGGGGKAQYVQLVGGGGGAAADEAGSGSAAGGGLSPGSETTLGAGAGSGLVAQKEAHQQQQQLHWPGGATRLTGKQKGGNGETGAASRKLRNEDGGVGGLRGVDSDSALERMEAGGQAGPAPARSVRLPPIGKWAPAVSSLAYCVASVVMILTNKRLLTRFTFSAPTVLLLAQNLMCVFAATGVRIMQGRGQGQNRAPLFSPTIAQLWFPVNLIFVGMLWSGFLSLKFLSVAMVTVLKNTTNILVVAGDRFWFGKRHPPGVWWSVALIILSAFAGGFTDLNFSAVGYIWQAANCVLTAAYSLRLRWVMAEVEEKAGGRLDEVAMMFYNNLLSVPLLLVLALWQGELPGVLYIDEFWTAKFASAVVLSGCAGIAISFCSLWCLRLTSPTTYSLVGSFNKLPTALLGILFFQSNISATNLLSIMFGLAAGVLFTLTKLHASSKPSA
eukprot:jgi/Chlat1/9069/Chrsp94S08320